MATKQRKAVTGQGHWRKRDVITRSTAAAGTIEPGNREVPTETVTETVNRILGYDLAESILMAQGYRELAEESKTIAESNLAASAETLPDPD